MKNQQPVIVYLINDRFEAWQGPLFFGYGDTPRFWQTENTESADIMCDLIRTKNPEIRLTYDAAAEYFFNE